MTSNDISVAVIVNGIHIPHIDYSHLIAVNRKLLQNFDIYYHTWDNQIGNFNKITNLLSCEEPTIDYNFYEVLERPIDKKSPQSTDWKKWSKIPFEDNKVAKSIKQLLGYSDAVGKINKTYDVLIRLRFDSWILPHLDLNELILECYNTGTVFGFIPKNIKNTLTEYTKIPAETSYINRDWLDDCMIIHKFDNFDHKYAEELFKQQKLYGAEYGWKQILVDPYNVDFKNILGNVVVLR